MTTERKTKPRKPGLMFRCLSVEFEDVKPAHRKPCDKCGSVPELVRLKLTWGSARNAVGEILCMRCGPEFFHTVARISEQAADACEAFCPTHLLDVRVRCISGVVERRQKERAAKVKAKNQ